MRDACTITLDFDSLEIAVSDLAALDVRFPRVGVVEPVQEKRSYYAGFLACQLLRPLMGMTTEQLHAEMIKVLTKERP